MLIPGHSAGDGEADRRCADDRADDGRGQGHPDLWDGAKLTILTKQEMGGEVTESTQVWTLDGSTLTVETTSARHTEAGVQEVIKATSHVNSAGCL